MICDVCGRGPDGAARVFVHPRWRALRTRDETLAWARTAGRRIGEELRMEIERERGQRGEMHEWERHILALRAEIVNAGNQIKAESKVKTESKSDGNKHQSA